MKVKILLTIFATIVISLAISNSVQAGVECSGWSCEGDKGVRTCTDSETGETWKEQNDLAECKGNNPDGDPNKCPTNEGDVTCREGKAYQCIQGTWERDSEYDSNCESGDDTNTWCPNGQRRCFNDELKECKGKWVGENWTNSWVTIGTCNNDSDNNNTTPATKSCSVSLANSSPTISAGTKVTVNFNGVTPSSTLDYVKVKIKKADGSKITPVPPQSVEEVISGKYYYDYPKNKCSTSNSKTCSGYTYINYADAPLPSGSYQAVCDISGTQNSTTFTITGDAIPPTSQWTSPVTLPAVTLENGTKIQGPVQAQAEVIVFGNCPNSGGMCGLQTVWINNKAYKQTYGVVPDGSAIDFSRVIKKFSNNDATLLSDLGLPNDASNTITGFSYAYLPVANRVIQYITTGNKIYNRYLSVSVNSSGVPSWSVTGANSNGRNAKGWSPSNLVPAPSGVNTIQAFDVYYHPDNYLVQILIANNKVYRSYIPLKSSGYADFSNPKFNSIWLDYNTSADSAFNIGSNPTQAYSSTYIGKGTTLLQSTWRNNQGFARTINMPDIPTIPPDTTPAPTNDLDVNEDGVVNILDVIAVLRYIFSQ